MSFEDPEEPFDDPEFLDDGEDSEEIDENEREALQQDLVDVKALKGVLALRGIKGVIVYCPDCEDDHFLGWDLLASNLQQILESGDPPVHEPAWEPDPDEYVTWDYARGFLDGYESFPEERGGAWVCVYCARRLPAGGYGEWGYCPSCGRDLAVLNLITELHARGWAQEEIAEVLDRAGYEPFAMSMAEIISQIDAGGG